MWEFDCGCVHDMGGWGDGKGVPGFFSCFRYSGIERYHSSPMKNGAASVFFVLSSWLLLLFVVFRYV